MRIATIQIYSQAVNQMQENTANAAKTQQKLATGKKVRTPADDPIASTRILQLNEERAAIDQYEKNITAVENRQKLEEAVLTGAVDIIQRVRELTVRAGDGSLTKTDRTYIATEVEELRDALLDAMNSKDAGNEYIFAGFKGDTLPFADRQGGGITYEGDEGQRVLPIAQTTNVATGDSGKALFIDIPSAQNTFETFPNPNNRSIDAYITEGSVVEQDVYDAFYPSDAIIVFNENAAILPEGPNFTVRRESDGRVLDGLRNVPYSPSSPISFEGVQVEIVGNPEPGDNFFVRSSEKQNVIRSLDNLSEGLRSFGDTPAESDQLDQLLSDTLINLDSALTTISDTLSQVGGRLNTIEATKNLHAEVEIVNADTLSQLESVEFEKETSQLALENFIIEASQQSFVTISRLTLFNFL